MLSSVLNSPRAIQVNIAIMRVFVKMREVLAAPDGAELLAWLTTRKLAHLALDHGRPHDGLDRG